MIESRRDWDEELGCFVDKILKDGVEQYSDATGYTREGRENAEVRALVTRAVLDGVGNVGGSASASAPAQPALPGITVQQVTNNCGGCKYQPTPCNVAPCSECYRVAGKPKYEKAVDGVVVNRGSGNTYVVNNHTSTYEPPPQPKTIKSRKPLARIAVGDDELRLLPDLRFWRVTSGLAKAEVVVPREQALMLLHGEKVADLEPRLVSWDARRLPPLAAIKRWRDVMCDACDTEAYVIMCRPLEDNKHPKHQWLGIVPEQEASSGGVEVREEHMRKCQELALARGYEPVGNLHLHPGGMEGASGTDTTEWRQYPGLYVIAPRSSAVVTVWVALAGEVWNADRLSLEGVRACTNHVCGMIGEGGEKKLFGSLVKPPNYSRGSVWTGGHGGGVSSGWMENERWSRHDEQCGVPGWIYANGEWQRASEVQGPQAPTKASQVVGHVGPGSSADVIRELVSTGSGSVSRKLMMKLLTHGLRPSDMVAVVIEAKEFVGAGLPDGPVCVRIVRRTMAERMVKQWPKYVSLFELWSEADAIVPDWNEAVRSVPALVTPAVAPASDAGQGGAGAVRPSAVPSEIERDCRTCAHLDVAGDSEPCCSCEVTKRPNWTERHVTSQQPDGDGIERRWDCG